MRTEGPAEIGSATTHENDTATTTFHWIVLAF